MPQRQHLIMRTHAAELRKSSIPLCSCMKAGVLPVRVTMCCCRLCHSAFWRFLQADAVFIQPKLPQRTTAEYAEKAFVKEVVKYGEMVQVSQRWATAVSRWRSVRHWTLNLNRMHHICEDRFAHCSGRPCASIHQW
jgi:hypothetical protein